MRSPNLTVSRVLFCTCLFLLTTFSMLIAQSAPQPLVSDTVVTGQCQGHFCLYGCFSGAQYVVFAGKSANEGRQLSRDRSHTAGSLRLPKPDLWLGPGNFAQPRREGPTGMAERGTQPSSLTTTSGGLLKQPYKQKATNRSPTAFCQTSSVLPD